MNKKNNQFLVDDQESLLEKTVVQAWQGVPELKKYEKQKFLGTFQERVMAILTEQEVVDGEEKILPNIKKAIINDKSKIILIRGDYFSKLDHYLNYARQKKLKFRVVSRPDSNGDIVLVIASDKAIK